MLTKRLFEAYAYIRVYIEKKGYSPTHTELQRHLGISSRGGAAKYIKKIEESGYITINKKIHRRNIELVSDFDVYDKFPGRGDLKKSNFNKNLAFKALDSMNKILETDDSSSIFLAKSLIKCWFGGV